MVKHIFVTVIHSVDRFVDVLRFGFYVNSIDFDL